ncbi:helical backbone metal receptor [Trinickia dinghuensis]|uniref:Cobalamin-binding protein n=1 Tax=Trinickia dinghuensis TaxID=2291023 RepID=A0A3D8K602_9BURK|nr:helical backbone metal receptor [Trinickia dinghuensis]RDU99981.1 cobalamin-binding protein [Trinickia dinghuensis]
MSRTDAAGIEHPPADSNARIVSLVPSITELLFALGLGDRIVGRTGFCIHPREAVRAVPKVGGTKAVKLDAVRALAPTHVIVNIDENEKPTIDALAQFVPHVVVTHPLAPHDNLSLYTLIGSIFGCEPAARKLADALSLRLNAIALEPWPERNVLYVIWRDPWMTVARDTYISAMLRLVNWQTWPAATSGFAGAGRYPAFDFDAPWFGSVERILLASEPYRFTAKHRDELAADPRLAGKTIQLVDGETISWYGSRAIEGIDYLRGISI